MMELSQNQLLYGSHLDLPEKIRLQAGPLSLIFESGTLRHIKFGDTVAIHQIYAAVRNHNWGTVVSELRDVVIDQQENRFHISFVSHHQDADIDFTWSGIISGDSDGTIQFTFDGQAMSTFQRNRIGFCVLHPATCAGQSCVVEHTDGSMTQGVFPESIAPHQPFFDIRAITHTVHGVDVRILMEGDTFEMEDQRNWTDASYKTYCTPLGLPLPATVESGDRIQQKITLSLVGDLSSTVQATEPTPLSIYMNTGVIGTVPTIGLGLPASFKPLAEKEIKYLRALNLDHLRVDLWMKSSNWQEQLKQAIGQATQLDCSLEIALFLTDDGESQIDAVQAMTSEQAIPVARWVIFHQDEITTSAKWLDLARQRLGDVPIGGGTKGNFTELNRNRPPTDNIDFAVFSCNPQVHAFDNISLMETLAMQAATVKNAREFCADKPIVVSPITLKQRASGDLTKGQLPPNVDARQMSLFGACWTLGSLKYMLESQTESVTYFETVGRLGVMDDTTLPRFADRFPSIMDGVYPMYHVFADLGELSGATMMTSYSSNHSIVDVLVCKHGDMYTILLANLTSEAQTVTLDIPPGTYRMRRLNTETAKHAMTKPEIYRANNNEMLTISENPNSLELLPYEYLRLKQTTN